MKLYRAKLKSRKQIMAEIPREQQGWWADVCPGATMTLRDATESDIARCSINAGQSRDPADYLCEACERGSLVRRIAINEITEIPDRRAPSSPASPSDTAVAGELPPLPEPTMGLWSEGIRKAWAEAMQQSAREAIAADRRARHQAGVCGIPTWQERMSEVAEVAAPSTTDAQGDA